MTVPEWIWVVFVFVFGCCVGSFLNVVVYRLPRELSLIRPGSACPSCKRAIRFYDNIPLVSWLVLGGRCRYCGSAISRRYFIIELLTGLVFAGVFVLYFQADGRAGIGPFPGGGWFIWLLHVILLSGLIAASAIDLELWVIPLSICWFVTAAGLVGSSLGVFVIAPNDVQQYFLLPSASARTAALAAGGAVGLGISWLLVATGLLKRSYESPGSGRGDEGSAKPGGERHFDDRREVLKELVFVLPVVICSAGAYTAARSSPAIYDRAVDLCSAWPAAAGFLGSLWGYFAGCAVVWAARIFGTLAFGREAMGLGDVHLMGGVGAVVGPVPVVVAFFVAPFFGLGWAAAQMFFRKTRQIPYGPFLSIGVLVVMILHDRIFSYLNVILYHGG